MGDSVNKITAAVADLLKQVLDVRQCKFRLAHSIDQVLAGKREETRSIPIEENIKQPQLM